MPEYEELKFFQLDSYTTSRLIISSRKELR
jgi:hypothetical protein